MLVAAAVCPHPVLLVPQVAGADAPVLDDVRAACSAAVSAVLAAAPDLIVAVGTDTATEEWPATAGGSLRRFGIPLDLVAGSPQLPLSLAIAAWLLARAGASGPRRYQAVATDAPPNTCLALGTRLARASSRVGLLVMADGSARRAAGSPGWPDPRAVPYDDAVADALRHGDVAALRRLDVATAQQLWVAGRAAWQVLAGAAGEHPVAAELLAYQAPYGVGYVVARWAL